MVLQDPGHLVVVSSGIVTLLALVMGFWSLNSYRATGNLRVLFVAVAFGVFVLKTLFVISNELASQHFVDHHASLYISALFDVVIVSLLFIPFVARGR